MSTQIEPLHERIRLERLKMEFTGKKLTTDDRRKILHGSTPIFTVRIRLTLASEDILLFVLISIPRKQTLSLYKSEAELFMCYSSFFDMQVFKLAVCHTG
jgi:hypothetical protein